VKGEGRKKKNIHSYKLPLGLTVEGTKSTHGGQNALRGKKPGKGVLNGTERGKGVVCINSDDRLLCLVRRKRGVLPHPFKKGSSLGGFKENGNHKNQSWRKSRTLKHEIQGREAGENGTKARGSC